MRIRFIWPGKIKDERLRSLVSEYLKRLAHFAKCEVIEVRESPASDRSGNAREAERILEAISPASLIVLLDEQGRELSSIQLADQVRRWEQESVKEVAIVIGGPNGVADAVKSRALMKWRLSRLTLTHEMARVIAAEQLYRAYTINRGLPYQK
jgi:23S rRNA (pseudouridine1915-N3)-methyltransferase